MNEQTFCTRLTKYLKHNMPYSFGWEAKFVSLEQKRGYNFKSDKSLQKEIRNLKLCGSHIVHKFSDYGGLGTLFDGIKLHQCPGYFFIQFYKPGVKHFYRLEVSMMTFIIKEGHKSLTEQIAMLYGDRCEFRG